jgi:hypothetical protein
MKVWLVAKGQSEWTFEGHLEVAPTIDILTPCLCNTLIFGSF